MLDVFATATSSVTLINRRLCNPPPVFCASIDALFPDLWFRCDKTMFLSRWPRNAMLAFPEEGSSLLTSCRSQQSRKVGCHRDAYAHSLTCGRHSPAESPHCMAWSARTSEYPQGRSNHRMHVCLTGPRNNRHYPQRPWRPSHESSGQWNGNLT
jgi:hypothetical protein